MPLAKKIIYIAAFGFLGLLLATLVHAGIEIIALEVIFGNPERFENTLWWQQWDPLHDTASTILWAAGLAVGLYLGKRYWRIIYGENRLRSK